jgi:hypothetical protein
MFLCHSHTEVVSGNVLGSFFYPQQSCWSTWLIPISTRCLKSWEENVVKKFLWKVLTSILSLLMRIGKIGKELVDYIKTIFWGFLYGIFVPNLCKLKIPAIFPLIMNSSKIKFIDLTDNSSHWSELE